MSASNEREILMYFKGRRERIKPFIDRHFDLKGYFQKSPQEIIEDFGRHWFNSFWILPYLAVKAIAEKLEKLGVDDIVKKVKQIPAGFKTGHDAQFEKELLNDLFEISDNDQTKALAQDQVLNTSLRNNLRAGLKDWHNKKLMRNDLASSGISWGAGYLAFDDMNGGIIGIGKHIASWWSYREASNSFFLGKDMGRAFYSIFPTHPTKYQVTICVFLSMTALALITFIVSLAMDPLMKKWGMHEKNLGQLVDDLENKLLTESRKAQLHRELEPAST